MKFNEILPRSPNWLHGESMVADFQQYYILIKLFTTPSGGLCPTKPDFDLRYGHRIVITNLCTISKTASNNTTSLKELEAGAN
jgi:hypothetical protein